jgi:hypothetical protein
MVGTEQLITPRDNRSEVTLCLGIENVHTGTGCSQRRCSAFRKDFLKYKAN